MSALEEENNPNFNSQLKSLLSYLKKYIRNPFEGIRNLPDWSWPLILLFQTTAAAICGVLTGVVSGRVSQIISGLIFKPIVTTIMISIAAGFFYYTLLFFYNRQFSYRKIFTAVTLANLPFMVIFIFSRFIPPVTLIGMGISSMLMVVCLVDHFGLPKKSILKFIGGLYLTFVLLWVYRSIQNPSSRHKMHERATPESIDILEKEMQQAPVESQPETEEKTESKPAEP